MRTSSKVTVIQMINYEDRKDSDDDNITESVGILYMYKPPTELLLKCRGKTPDVQGRPVCFMSFVVFY